MMGPYLLSGRAGTSKRRCCVHAFVRVATPVGAFHMHGLWDDEDVSNVRINKCEKRFRRSPGVHAVQQIVASRCMGVRRTCARASTGACALAARACDAIA